MSKAQTSTFAYYRPSTLKEASALFQKLSMPMYYAGGQAILLSLRSAVSSQPEQIIDLKHIQELKGIQKKSHSLIIHSLCTYEEVINSKVIQNELPALAHICQSIADIHIRKRATLVGALIENDCFTDISAVMLALEAKIHTNLRSLPYNTLLQSPEKHLLHPGEIVKSIEIPHNIPLSYHKHTKQASHFPVVGVCVARHQKGPHVAVTGCLKRSFRVPYLEQILAEDFNQTLDKTPIDHQAFIEDIHASKDFRAHLLRHLTMLCVQDIS